jgi:acetate kinase
MEFFGIKIDLDANAKTYKPQGPMEISTPDSKVKVFVIPTNEELMIARETDRIVSARK